MAFKQIATLVNQVYNQSIGNGTGVVVNNKDVISLGKDIISSNTNMEKFMDTLVQRIGKVIFVDRKYRSIYNDLELDEFSYGNVVQKISVTVGDFKEDDAYKLVDGQSIDPWIVNKPKAIQKLFTTETPYSIDVTIQRELLVTAFESEQGINKLIATIFTELENKIELSMEALGRNTINNFMVECLGTSASTSKRVVNLIEEYNKTAEYKIDTRVKALKDLSFLQFASKFIKDTSKYMESPTSHYNDGSVVRFTPSESQKLYMLTDFVTTLQTEAYAIVYNADWLKLTGYKEIPFWQSFDEKDKIVMKRASDEITKTLTGVVGVIFDRNALGMFKNGVWTATTPVNAYGGYFNTVYHFKQLFFNDLAENGIVLTINDVVLPVE